jgi:hypothetical protein
MGESNLLNSIQKKLKAPKGQYNSFGKYKYRNAEDILEAVKPLLGSGTLVISDEVVQIGDRFYLKATATLRDGEVAWSASAFARESREKKGMDDAQVTGAASSYARKYALNGLFCIDDTKDADSDDRGVQVSVSGSMEPYRVERKEAAAVPKEFVEEEIESAQKEKIRALMDALGEKQTKANIKKLTGFDAEEKNYKQIIEVLQAKVDATDPLTGALQNAE